MNDLQDKKALKLLCSKADGEVWTLAGDGPPEPSGLKAGDFLKNFVVPSQCKSVRLMGDWCNAELIVGLMKAGQPVELCSPLCCPSERERSSPREALVSMRGWGKVPGIKGGWHLAMPDERIFYEARLRGSLPDLVGEFMSHPLWDYLSFVPTARPRAALEVCSKVLDPRWFVDCKRPDRLAKLESFLGLPRNNHPDRFKAVLDAWRQNDLPPKQLAEPANFLYRLEKSVSAERGVILACKLFVSFLRSCWLDMLYPNRPEPFFDPDIFFDKKSESEAFKQHMRSKKK